MGARAPTFASRERRGPPAPSLGTTLIDMYQLRDWTPSLRLVQKSGDATGAVSVLDACHLRSPTGITAAEP
jgi:hypothetical protein